MNTTNAFEAAPAAPAVDEEAVMAEAAAEVAASDDAVSNDVSPNAEPAAAADDEEAPAEAQEKEVPPRHLPKVGRYMDVGNDLIEAPMPDVVQAADEDEMRRAIRQHRVLYAKVVGIEPLGDDGIKIVAKRNTMRVVFVPTDFFKHSVMKDMEGLTEAQKTIRYRRKANRMLGAVISFIPLEVSEFTDDYGTRIPFAVGSRAAALEELQKRFFFHPTEQTRVEVGSRTTASVLSCGPRYVIVEAFGVEVSMGTGALSAFEYIEDVSKTYHVGMGIPVAVESLKVDQRAGTVDLRVSHALLERMTAKVEGVSESMIKGRYLATIVSVGDKFYHVVLDGMKIRGVIPKNANITDEMLSVGDKVSMLVHYINKEQGLVIGGCHKI